MYKDSLFLLLLSITLFACSGAPSEEDIQEEFAIEVEMSRDCESDQECVIVSPGCPLGCGVAVNASRREVIQDKAISLISEYESDGISCSYSCIPQQAKCNDNKLCEVSGID